MTTEQIFGNWAQLKGQMKQQWGKLTDDELLQAEGKMDVLSGLIQERYGKTKDDALNAINEFFKAATKEINEPATEKIVP